MIITETCCANTSQPSMTSRNTRSARSKPSKPASGKPSVNDPVNPSSRVNRRLLSWKEKGPCRPKPCRWCGESFSPPSGGDFYCQVNCKLAAKRESHRKAVAEQRRKKPEQYRRSKANWDLLQYGLTLAQYEEFAASNGNVCAICGSEKNGGHSVTRKLVVDHSHETGEVRGLLCANCNSGIGLLQDDPEVLRKAIQYLEDFANGKRPC